MLDKFSTLKFAFKPRALSGMKLKPTKESDFKDVTPESALKKNGTFNVLFHAHVTKEDGSIEFFEYVAVDVKKEYDWKKFKAQYGFSPNYEIDGTYVFVLPQYVERQTYEKYVKALTFVLDGTEAIGLKYPGTIVIETGMEAKVETVSESDNPDFSKIVDYVNRVENQSLRKLGLERENVASMENAIMTVPFATVFERLGTPVNSEGFIK